MCWTWEVKETLLLLVTPIIAIIVLFLVTQAGFGLLLHCKKNKPEEMGQEEKPHSQICWVLRSGFLSSP